MKNYPLIPYRFTFFSLFFLLSLCLSAQSASKREMRGVWVATVFGIDYPAKPTTDDVSLRDSWIRLIDKHKAMGINALFVQIRPMADALYPSNLVPWSRFLTGQSGVSPANNFDMLGFMIATAHERDMEFHAWLNPYRVSMDNPNASNFAPNHVLRTHPEWCLRYNKRYFLNPGLPEVRAHMNDVVTEIVSRYAVDGIHFDDYFYPYKAPNEQLNDYSTFKKYPNGLSNIEDWRRNNVDLLIAQLSQTIKRLRPAVQFGVSPFSVWRNRSRDPEGSDTRAGVTCYDDLYADVRKWLREGWIDYVAPQAYRAIGSSLIDHEIIMRWWSDNAAGKTVYAGHATYRVGTTTGNERNWNDPNEIPRQIRLARSLPNVGGSLHYSSKSLIKNALGVGDSLRLNYYRYPSTPTEIYTNNQFLTCEPVELKAITSDANGKIVLNWRSSALNPQRQPFQYVVYRFRNGEVDFKNGHNIIGIFPPNTQTYIFYELESGGTNQYAVMVSECINGLSPFGNTANVNKPSQAGPSVSKTKSPRKRRGWFGSFWRRVFGK